jgi:modulator of FtsH protease
VEAVIDGWENFFLGHVGASAALGGLLFVAISINIERILTFASLPDRALMALELLLAILIVSSLMLIPAQSTTALGIEVLVVGLVVLVHGTILDLRGLRRTDPERRGVFIAHVVLFEVAVLPYAIGAVLLITGDLAGVYWIAASIILSFIKAVLDAWVLLVEINR